MSEAAGRGDRIEAAALRSFFEAENAFYERLLRAQAEGELPPGRDLRSLARFFAATMRTLALVHRLTGDRHIVDDIAAEALARLG